MSLRILMDRFLLQELARGAEAECFLIGTELSKRLDREVDGLGLGPITRYGPALRAPSPPRKYRHVPVVESPQMNPNGLELIVRPHRGQAEVVILL